jgi:hypothetical protein
LTRAPGRRGPSEIARLGALAFTLLALLVATKPASARQIEGVRFASELSARDTSLTLHGVGLLRWRSLLKVYAAALYLAPGADPARALDDVPKRLEIAYFFAFEPSDFVRATNETLPRNTSAEEIAQIRPALEQLNALYRPIEPGDRYALTYVPGVGTELSLNGDALGVVPGADLARAIFGIWLGASPKDASLKEQLLSGR